MQAVFDRYEDALVNNRVAVLDAGRLVACGRPGDVLRPRGREVLAVCEQFLQLAQHLEATAGGVPSVGGLVRVGLLVPLSGPSAAIGQIKAGKTIQAWLREHFPTTA